MNVCPVFPAAGHGAGFHEYGWFAVCGGKKHAPLAELHDEGTGTQLETSSDFAACPSM